MSQINEPAQESLPLAKVARARPRVLQGLLWGAGLAVLSTFAAIGVFLLVCHGRKPDCRSTARTETDAQIVLVCEREYRSTGNPTSGALLADAYRRSKNFELASALANGLLVTSARGEAFRVLGKIAGAQNRPEAAMSALETARDLHRAEARRGELAKDDQAIVGILQSRHQYAQALRMLEECISEARAANELITKGHCHVTASYVLAKEGNFKEAQQELDLAEPLLKEGRDLTIFEAQQANLFQELLRSPVDVGSHKQAIVIFKEILDPTKHVQLPELALSAELNLAASLAEIGEFDAAEQYLAAAKLLDTDDAHASDRAGIAARIAYRRGDLPLAFSLNDRLYPTLTNNDDRISVSAMQAHIALTSNDLDGAERWARRGVADAEKVHAAESGVELRPWILETRREPYELLFTALARANRANEALDVFDQWQGRTLLDTFSHPAPTGLLDLRGAANRSENFNKWLPIVSDTPLMKTSRGHLASEAARSIDLFALVIADHQLWRVTAEQGQLHLDDLGPYEKLKQRIDRFKSTPTDHVLAEELAQLLMRDVTFRPTRETLRVVLDGPLSALPVAALRRNGKPLIAMRPIVRAPRISEAACMARPPQPRTAIVLADAENNLPDARAEAQELAAMFGITSAIGAEATSATLFAASRNNLLHVAVHAAVDANGSYLQLFDQRVHALDISTRQLGPALVVLSSCDSAMSDDLDLARSLPTAFLTSGSTQVMATLSPINDKGARELISRFYREGGANDPVHVLANIQASLANTNNTDWPNFAVFGHDLCNQPSKP